MLDNSRVFAMFDNWKTFSCDTKDGLMVLKSLFYAIDASLSQCGHLSREHVTFNMV